MAAAIALVEVIDQVLVVGERVRGLHMTVDNAVTVVDDLENRGDAVGGAGCSRDDLVGVLDGVVVDAVDDVLQVTLARCGQQDAGDTLGFQVLLQALALGTRVVALR